MASSGAAPDSYTLNALLRASAATGQPRRALALYRLLHRSHGVAPDSATFSLLAWALAPVGDGPRAALLAREWVENGGAGAGGAGGGLADSGLAGTRVPFSVCFF